MSKEEGAPPVGKPVPIHELLTDEDYEVIADEDAYETDDPKHPSWRERLAALWDQRPGK